MRSYVIFSDEELLELTHGKPVEDDVNHIVYVSEEGYEKHIEKRASNDEKWN